MLLMIDNYDSFTYNLVQYFGELKEQVKVFRNDKITLSEIQKMNPGKIVDAQTIEHNLRYGIEYRDQEVKTEYKYDPDSLNDDGWIDNIIEFCKTNDIKIAQITDQSRSLQKTAVS